MEAEEDSNFSFVAFDDPAQMADLRDRDASRFDGKDDLAGLSGFVVMEVKATIDASVGTFLLFDRACAYQAKRPVLKLILIFIGETLGPGKVCELVSPIWAVAVSSSGFRMSGRVPWLCDPFRHTPSTRFLEIC